MHIDYNVIPCRIYSKYGGGSSPTTWILYLSPERHSAPLGNGFFDLPTVNLTNFFQGDFVNSRNNLDFVGYLSKRPLPTLFALYVSNCTF
jgi:hypothetical protein